MSHLSLHHLQISETTSEDILEKYALRTKALRLKSLQSDPASFSSRYESEAVQPMAFWMNRLKEPKARTIVMVKAPDTETRDDSAFLLRDNVSWVGFNVCVEIRDATTGLAKEEQKEAGSGDWYLAAVYLEKSVRGNGAGTRLVQFGIDLMRRIEQEHGRTGGVCTTNVLNSNERALPLYLKLGFEVTDTDVVQEKEGRVSHSTAIRLRL